MAASPATTTAAAASSSSVSTGDTSSSPPSRLLHHQYQIALAAADSGGGGGGPGPRTAQAAQLHAARGLPRVGVGTGGGGGQNQACAACKYQRRKCNPDCPLARYFPADDQRRFLNAHRLFGVSNIQKTLRRTTPDRHQDAMRALTFEAEARAQDPVGGAARIVVQLRHEYDVLIAELSTVLHHLAIFRQQAAAAAASDVAMAEEQLNDPTAMLLNGGGDAIYFDRQPAGEAAAAVQAGGGGGFQDQNPYGYLHYGTADDEGSSHAWINVDSYGNGGEAGLIKTESLMSLGEQLQQNCQIEAAAPFVDALDPNPESMTTTTEHHGIVLVEHPEEKVAAVAGSSSGATAQCQLKLGFSSQRIGDP